MSWTNLDDGFWMHPKVMRAGNEGAGIFCRCLSYCGKYLTDGRVPREVAIQIAGTDRKLDKVVQSGLLEELPASGDLFIRDYSHYNMLRDEIEHRREQRRLAGSKGGKARAAARNGAGS